MANTELTLYWKKYLRIGLETMLAFYIATFCIGYVLITPNEHWVIFATTMAILYLITIIICIRRLIIHFPLAAMMLIIPIAPLFVLITVVTVMPLLQWTQ